MTAEIIQFRDYQHRQPTSAKEQERQAIELINVALMGEPTMDTAPSEYCAPDEDSA